MLDKSIRFKSDRRTAELVELLSRRWSCSGAEAIRRAIRIAYETDTDRLADEQDRKRKRDDFMRGR